MTLVKPLNLSVSSSVKRKAGFMLPFTLGFYGFLKIRKKQNDIDYYVQASHKHLEALCLLVLYTHTHKTEIILLLLLLPDEETEVPRGEICPGSHRSLIAKQALPAR